MPDGNFAVRSKGTRVEVELAGGSGVGSMTATLNIGQAIEAWLGLGEAIGAAKAAAQHRADIEAAVKCAALEKARATVAGLEAELGAAS